ncbi:rubredoxin [Burkholderia sp. WAC0059]|uniref:rubredoxin n=1 Tax=Burkholderia sp. WAC0059 TaxID=2066022 RepID=UPI000C7ECF81|nr:rubredoxin [Burkholderia sp. WAC0059]PLZ04156.1 rubredoxin [Burkholderia sp. WAC0059]
MYKKGVAVEIQFSPERLNDAAGDPYWIDLSAAEATALLRALQTQLGEHEAGTASPLVITLDAAATGAGNAAAPTPTSAPSTPTAAPEAADSNEFKQWVCLICGWIYDEAAGAPDEGLAPGTRWADVPDDWRCPLCDVGKEDFALVEF